MDDKTSRGVAIAAVAVLGAGVLCAAARHFKKACGGSKDSGGCGGSCSCGDSCACGSSCACPSSSRSEQKSAAEDHEYTFTYFTLRARGEVTRLLFAAKQVQYKDVRFDMSPSFNHDSMLEDREKNPSKYPWGQLPSLKVDDGPLICHSRAIERFLAKEFGLFGSNKFEAALIDGVVEAMADLQNAFIRVFTTVEQAKQPEALAKHYESNARVFEQLERMLNDSPGAYLVGDKPSLADLSVYHWVHTQCVPDLLRGALKNCPKLAKHKKTVEAIPGVQQWLEVRPETFF